MNLLQAALAAYERGWNVIPIDRRKQPHDVLILTGHSQPGPYGRPVPRWRDFQKERVTPDLLRRWFDSRQAVPGLAAVTGQISNLVVLDFDGEAGQTLFDRWGIPPNSLSGSGGPHLYFPHPGWRVSNRASSGMKHPPFPGLDVRGDGGLIILPPSHLNNGLYRSISTERLPVSVLPSAVAAWTGLSRECMPPTPPAISEPLPSGDLDLDACLQEALQRATWGRDNAGYQLACRLHAADVPFHTARQVMARYAEQVPQHDSKGQFDPYTLQDALRNLRSASRASIRSQHPVRKRSLEEQLQNCLPHLTPDEYHEVSRLLAATLLREGHHNVNEVLTSLHLDARVIDEVAAQLHAGISLRGRAALERFLRNKHAR